MGMMPGCGFPDPSHPPNPSQNTPPGVREGWTFLASQTPLPPPPFRGVGGLGGVGTVEVMACAIVARRFCLQGGGFYLKKCRRLVAPLGALRGWGLPYLRRLPTQPVGEVCGKLWTTLALSISLSTRWL